MEDELIQNFYQYHNKSVDKPYTVPVDRPVPAPYVAKVVQPMIHKQTVVSSAILPAHK